MSDELTSVAGLQAKLKNRRVALWKLSDGTWHARFKTLEACKVITTDLRLSNESMMHLVSMFGQISSCENTNWAILHEDGVMSFGRIGG